MPILPKQWPASSNSSEACSSAFDGMQPTLRQVPPKVALFSTTAVFRPKLRRANGADIAAGAGADDDEVVGHDSQNSAFSIPPPTRGRAASRESGERVGSTVSVRRPHPASLRSAALPFQGRDQKSQIQHEPRRVLQAFLHPHQEGDRLAGRRRCGDRRTAPDTSSAGSRSCRRCAIGRSWILCMPRMPDCGAFRIGVDISEP